MNEIKDESYQRTRAILHKDSRRVYLKRETIAGLLTRKGNLKINSELVQENVELSK